MMSFDAASTLFVNNWYTSEMECYIKSWHCSTLYQHSWNASCEIKLLGPNEVLCNLF